MGKDYAESSLKRFLKKRVRITLGLVVTFLITGMAVFAEGTEEIIQKEHKNEWEWLQVKEAEKYLSSTKDKFGEDISGNYITVGENGTKISYDIINTLFDRGDIDRNFPSTSITFEKGKISDETLKNINSTLAIMDTNFNKKFSDNEVKNIEIISGIDSTGYNTGIELIGKESTEVTDGLIETGTVTVTAGKTGINIGTINNTQKGTNSVLYNYGLIKGGQVGATAYNYGFLSQPASGMAQEVTVQGYNYGIIASNQTGQVTSSKYGELYNYGIILSGGLGGENDYGQLLNTVSEAYAENNGIINTKKGQGIASIVGGKYTKSSIVNKGTIFATSTGQLISGHGGEKSFSNDNILYNYGVISAVANNNTQTAIGQEIKGKGENNKAYNFGEITGDNGQKLSSQAGYNSSFAYNYGTIESTSKGQYVAGTEISGKYSYDKAYNYGIINAGAGKGQYLEKSGEIYNFGIIKNDGTDYAMEVKNGVTDKYKAENYGVIDISSQNSGKAFSGDITNRGFVITKDGTVDGAWTGKNQGVVLDENLELAQGSTGAGQINENVIDLSKETGEITLTNDKIMAGDKDLSGTDKQTTVFMKNQSAVLTGDKYDGKNINIVADDNYSSDKVLVEANLGNDKALDLTNTTVSGYFAGTKGGTVLAVDSDLTLVGDTVISAIKGENVKEDVFALSLDKDAMLTFVGENTQINGMINGKEGGITAVAAKKFETLGDIGILRLRNANENMINNSEITKESNYTDVKLGENGEVTVGELQLSFRGTAEDKTNKVHLTENVKVTGNIDGSLTVKGEGEGYENNQIDLTLDKISNVGGDITLGEYDDKITVNQKLDEIYSGTVDGNLGNDTLVVKTDTSKAVSEGIFDYKINNIENINLEGDWSIGENAEINFKDNNGSSKVTTSGNSVNLNVSGKLTAEMNNNKGNGDFVTSLDKITSGNNMTITAQGGIKYEMGENFAINSNSFTTNSKFELGQYDVENEENGTKKEIVKEDTKLTASGIFNIIHNDDNSVTLRVKSAEELGIEGYSAVYEAILAGVGSNQDLTDKLNSLEDSSKVAELVKSTQKTAEAYYTAGNVVTKNIVDTYLSAVSEFKDRAEKGQWIAYGKYINSDTEFDNGSKVKGYEGDITGTVGMIEYGMTDVTSYGAVFGKGDTEVDINDGGELSGDNYYGGVYFKHRTTEGIDVLGSFGYVKSDLDSKLKNSFDVPELNTSSSALVDGTADSKAVSVMLKAKKDYIFAEGIKVKPTVGAALTLITQEEAENRKMGFSVSQQDVDVYELITGVDISKEFELEAGKLEIGAGIEYSWANSNQDRDAKYMLNGRELNLEDSEIASSKRKMQFGAEYIHENGVGIDGKYEMIWSDTGDDSRITAGVSYRF